jgi:hypothetical protein
MISSGLLLVAGALCLTVAMFYMGITTSATFGGKPPTNMIGVLGVSSGVGSGVFILSALALYFMKISKATQGLVGMLVLGTAIALFVGVYYTVTFMKQIPGAIQVLESAIGELKQQKQTPQVISETDALTSLLNFYTWGPGLGGAAGGLAILALGMKHGLKL